MAKPSAPKGVPADIPLPRSQVVLIGTGAFGVSMLPSWALLLRRWYGWTIRPCLTYSATQLVAPAALAAASHSRVWGPDWPTDEGVVPHRALAEWADLIMVAPATTNFIGKCATGISDNLALSVTLASSCPVVLVPSVPAAALGRPSVKRNLEVLAQDGYHVVPPVVGVSVHTGQAEPGGMPDIGTTLRYIGAALAPAQEPEQEESEGRAS